MAASNLYVLPLKDREEDLAKRSVQASELRDLADLSTHWRALRADFVPALDSAEMDPEARAMVDWLILLADRVCPYDYDPVVDDV